MRPRGARVALLCLALVAATLAVYRDVSRFEFVDLDDPAYVPGNPVVSQGLTLDGVVWAFTESHDANWFPLTWLSHMLDVELFGLNAGAHHATNVLLHAANALLLLGALLALTHALWPSALVAALFALHPLHVESVAWVAERKDVLSTAFGFGAIWLYARYARSGAKRWLAACTIAFALGLMAKPMLVTLPCVLLLLDFWPLGRWRRETAGRLVREKLPLFVLSAISCAITLSVQGAGGAVRSAGAVALADRLTNAVVAYAIYLRQTVWPAGLSVHYPHPALPAEGGEPLSALAVAGAILLLIAASAAAWRARGPVWMGWLWFLGTLVPVIGLVQVGGQAHADRYTYLPLVGVFVAVAFGVRGVIERTSLRVRAVAVASGLALLVAFSLAAHARVQVWRDSETLFTSALAVDPGNHTARYGLALSLRGRGRLAEAAGHYRRILSTSPDAARAWNGLGRTQQLLGQREAAVASFTRAVELQPDTALAWSNLGSALRDLGRGDEARAAFERAAALDPRSRRARRALQALPPPHAQ